MDSTQLAAVIDEITGGNQSEYARLTGITPGMIRRLLTHGASAATISKQTAGIATLLLLCKQHGLLDEAKKALHIANN